HEHVGLDTNQLFRKRLRPGLITIGVTALEGPVLTFDVSEVSHPLQESIKNTLSARLGSGDHTADHGACQSLSESRERPRRRAAEQRDEVAPFQWQRLPCFRTKRIAHDGLLRCGISIHLMSGSGHERQIDRLATWAAFPLRPRKRRSAIKMQIR